MENFGLTSEELEMLEDFAQEPICNFFLLFVFFRDEPLVPILIWPGETIAELIENYAHKTIADIGGLYFFKDTNKRIQELHGGYCNQSLNDEQIWTYCMSSSLMDGTPVTPDGFPYMAFYERGQNGIFIERDGGDTALMLIFLASSKENAPTDLFDENDELDTSLLI